MERGGEADDVGMDVTSAKRAVLRAAVVSLCITAGLAILALLSGDLDETSGRVLATTALLSAYSFLALPAGVLLDRGEARPLAIALIVLVLVAFALLMGEIWIADDPFDDDSGWKAIVVSTLYAGACAQTGSLIARSRPDDPPTVVNLGWAAIALVFMVATFTSGALLDEHGSEGLTRFIGVLGVLDVLAVSLRPLVRRMETVAAPATPEPVPAAAPAPDRPVPSAPEPAARAGAHRFTCTLDRPIGGSPKGVPGRLREGGREIDCELDAASFGAAVGAAVALIEDAATARVVRIERTD